ncbi:MAG: hypothetical protein LLF76_12235 [Planctomycetaceae bacterium]|nr:hypothetical protein [Planctomycetaceae bacterium]
MHAAEGLTQTGDPNIVIQSLSTMLATEGDDQKRCGLAREILRAGDESKISVLVEILSNRESNGRTHAAENLFKVQRIGDLELMIECANDTHNPSLQLWALANLIKSDHMEYLPMLRQFLNSQSTFERAMAAYLLGQLGDKNEIDRIKEGAEQTADLDALFFYNAGVIYLKDSDATEKLKTYLDDENKTIRALSAYTVGSLVICSCQQKLITLLDDREEDVRIRSAHALLSMYNRSTIAGRFGAVGGKDLSVDCTRANIQP